MDADIGLMHTLFALEDLRGLTIGKLDGEFTREDYDRWRYTLHRDESTADKRPAGCLVDSRHRYRSPIDSKMPLPTHLSVRALLIWTCYRRAARGNHSGPACHLHGRMFHPPGSVIKSLSKEGRKARRTAYQASLREVKTHSHSTVQGRFEVYLLVFPPSQSTKFQSNLPCLCVLWFFYPQNRATPVTPG